MPLYICVLLQKSTVLKIADYEADDLRAAMARAEILSREFPICSRYEIWHGGLKLHSAQPGDAG